MTPSGIEPAAFRFVAQHLNHCATAVPLPQYVQKALYKHIQLYVCILTRSSFSVLNLAVSAWRPNFTAVARTVLMG